MRKLPGCATDFSAESRKTLRKKYLEQRLLRLGAEDYFRESTLSYLLFLPRFSFVSLFFPVADWAEGRALETEIFSELRSLRA